MLAAVRARTIMAITVLTILLISLVGIVTANTNTGNSWVTKAPISQPRADLGVSTVNGKIYAIGGSINNTFFSSNEKYNPMIDSWTYRSPMPTPRSNFGIIACQGKIYCIGGNANVNYTSGYRGTEQTGVNEVYDPENDSWETKAPMPTPRGNLQANIVNGKIYLIGGTGEEGPVNNVEVYDPNNDSWKAKTPMPNAVGTYISAAVNNKIYIISSGLTQIYNAENDSWSVGAPCSPFDYVFGCATVGVFAPLLIYAFTAEKETIVELLPGIPQTPISYEIISGFKIQYYDPQTDSWAATNASMPVWRYGAAVAVINDLFYVIGGYNVVFHYPAITPEITASTFNQLYTPNGYGTVPPKISLTSPVNANYTTGNITLIFTLNKATSWMGYSLDGQANVTVDGNTTLANLAGGLHNVTVYVNDTFGNVAGSQTVSFNVQKQQQPFPPLLLTAAVGAVVVGIAAGLAVVFKKHVRRSETQES